MYLELRGDKGGKKEQRTGRPNCLGWWESSGQDNHNCSGQMISENDFRDVWYSSWDVPLYISSPFRYMWKDYLR